MKKSITPPTAVVILIGLFYGILARFVSTVPYSMGLKIPRSVPDFEVCD